jgi:hypothetical protein
MTGIITYLEGTDPAILFYAVLLLAFVLLRIPVLNNYFRTLNTLLHESGHALMAILLSGEALEIKLNSNTSGSALTRTNSKGKAFLISFSGYPAASLGSFGLLALAVNQHYSAGFLILVSIAIINLIVFIRNSYGIFWLITFILLMLLANWYAHSIVASIFYLFISLIAFIEGITSAAGIVILGFTKPSKAGDLSNMAKMSKIPAFFWALIMAVVVGVISWFTISKYFPPISQLFT